MHSLKKGSEWSHMSLMHVPRKKKNKRGKDYLTGELTDSIQKFHFISQIPL